MTDKVQLVQLSARWSFNPAMVTDVHFDTGNLQAVTISFSGTEELKITNAKELEAFKRWHAEHNTDRYLPDEAPF